VGARYTLSAASTSALTVDPAERWRVLWSLTISGVIYTFADRPAVLVDYDVWPSILDADLTAEDPGVARMLGTTLSDFEAARADGWTEYLRDIASRGVHPQQVTDGGYHRTNHLRMTLYRQYRAAGNALNDQTYIDEAERWRKLYEAGVAQVVDYDADADGVADSKKNRAIETHHDLFAERPRLG
jgi:hypothetical protein